MAVIYNYKTVWFKKTYFMDSKVKNTKHIIILDQNDVP